MTDFRHRMNAAATLHANREQASGTSGLSGYVVLSAQSLDAAKNLVSGRPGLKSGVSVEIAETVRRLNQSTAPRQGRALSGG